MNVNVILAGLDERNRETVLKRIEFLKEGLRKEAFFCCLDMDTYGEEADLVKTAVKFIEEKPADFTVFAGTYEGKEIGKKAAAGSGRVCLTDVEYLEECEGTLKAVRKVYSTHLEQLEEAGGKVLIISSEGPAGERLFEAEPLDYQGVIKENTGAVNLLKEELIPVKEDLSQAKVVLLGGKGLGNKANYERLERLAEKMGVSSASTRLAALNGWAGYDKIVGISGWSLNAEVCIAFGVSGAGPLMQGLKGVKKLIAVNNDRKAPIFSKADYGIEADCIEIIEALESMES